MKVVNEELDATVEMSKAAESLSDTTGSTQSNSTSK